MKGLAIIMSCLLWAGCRSSDQEMAPVLVKGKAIVCPGEVDTLVVRVDGDIHRWSFYLLTQREPIRLTATADGDRLIIPLRFDSGFYAGTAAFCCASKDKRWFFPLQLKSDSTQEKYVIRKEYRSPKTVNPDSGLQQQRIRYAMDQNRNLLKAVNAFFSCDMVVLPARSGSYLLPDHRNLTAVYVQPGTAREISLQAGYDRRVGQIRLSVSNLKDGWGNRVADGTLVKFNYRPLSNRVGFRTIEAFTYHGKAGVVLPPGSSSVMAFAQIDRVHSNIRQISFSR